jgi:ribosomal protein S27E
MIDKQENTGTARLLRVECGGCGWKSRRAAGKLVWCPKCGQCAAFQPEQDSRAAATPVRGRERIS